ncbi:16S rRNA m(7)G-527 methyltransferase [Austwickia chelonae]|uniref:Ribosomal RNA small subunit methyltransferase G n=1 Tax=Austwickia chelonae NBRC 105200 TaxID=1184607 RepID=K6VA15_9MICO|nr:16S rRNA (guanine(527)-N(7))-methyltransferase RsmG [Austwickia chelonae]GAB79063.1 ribosomal RNA small subunit methyltransferase G [Austwickia chelonae NBRC 105200]SEW41989.1 16S rRNA m(7)G-527 methyltransferase [Austwickia chelonae]
MPDSRREDLAAADPVSEVPAAPSGAADCFRERLPLACAYVDRLADSGVRHGLIGPREIPRLWERHVLNCGVVGELIPEGVTVIDVGSGAGLPGIPLAIARPDIHVILVEPLLRRTVWLEETVAELGLETVEIRRGKAEAFHGELIAPIVTARAVSRLVNLGTWSAPLLSPGGKLLALKGASVDEELRQDVAALRKLGFVSADIVMAGIGVVDPATTVASLALGPKGARGTKARRSASRARRGIAKPSASSPRGNHRASSA